MKNNRNICFRLIIMVGISLMLLTTCKEVDEDSNIPNKLIPGFNPTLIYGTMTDQDGNEYQTIKIGSQTWMAENLRTTLYNDGCDILQIEDSSIWQYIGNGAYCTYENTTNPDSITIFGRLYNWHAVSTGKLAPKGWHLPTDDEWQILEDYLISNGYNYDGTYTDNKIAIAMASYVCWDSSTNIGAIGNSDSSIYRNKSGFTALPSGVRNYIGSFGAINTYCTWWSNTEDPLGINAWTRTLYKDFIGICKSNDDKQTGNSVRCLMD